MANAELLAAVEIDVPPDDALAVAAVRQQWHVAPEQQAWLEPFLLVAYSTKQVSNFRGDTALGVWLSLTGQGGGGINYMLADALESVGGTYSAQVFQRTGSSPFIQTPATGGSRRFRDLEVAGSARALFNALRRNSPESARRIQAAMEALKDLGNEFAQSPSVSSANQLTWAVMRQLQAQGAVPTVETLLAAEQTR